MRFAILIVFIIVSCSYALEEDDILQKFKAFQTKFGKSYRSPVETRKRLTIFKQSLKKIEAHNALYERGLSTYKKGVNQFADWTAEEFRNYLNKGLKTKSKITGEIFEKNEKFTAPVSIDWREQGAVTPVKNQGGCGSCWAFSTTGTIEGQLKLVNGVLNSLSEQNLMDCSWYLGNAGCGGGEMFYGLDYVQEHGLEREEDYPYEEESSHRCKANASKIVTKISSYVTIPENDDNAAIEALATKGPLSIAILATDNFQLYEEGVFNDSLCDDSPTNHGVLMVGYGSQDGNDYYLVKNSWGEEWGEKGYIKVSRKPTNLCGILTEVRYPIL